MKPIFRLIPFFIVLGVMSVVLAVPVAGQSTEDTKVYLPMVAQQRTYSPSLSIYGRVRRYFSNERTVLALDYFDGVTTTTFATTTVITTGNPVNNYYFLNLPLLEEGQSYRVSYYNGQYGNVDQFRYLKSWHSFPITQTADGSVSGGVFSVLDLPMLFPSGQRQVQSPFIFEWRGRWGSGTSSDHFVLNFYDMNETLLYTTPDLGHTFSYEFNPLTVGLALNTPYLWDVRVANPDGSLGISREPKREVVFVQQIPIASPTGLTAECNGGSTKYNFCRFNWQPVEGATGYFIEAAHEVNGWTGATSAEGLIWCAGSGPRPWRVKARSDTEEGTFTEATYTVLPCPPPCDPCMREMFKEQPVWQSYQREPY